MTRNADISNSNTGSSTTTTVATTTSPLSTALMVTTNTATVATTPTSTGQALSPAMTLSANPPIPLSTYISLSQVAISSALKVAMVSTSLSLGIARTIVSGVDKVLGMAVNGVVGQNDEGSRGLSPAAVASLPFRAALLGINFSDVLVQTILETVDGSVNLALTTLQDGLDLMDTLFGPDSTSQTGETFREVWAILNREFTQGEIGYPALEGMRLLMAYVAIQFATSEQWETIRVRTQGRLVGECLESKDEETGSSTAWSALADWPEEWKLVMTEDELLQEQRIWELREHHEGRSAAYAFSAASSTSRSSNSGATGSRLAGRPNPELTNFLAASYRFSRFCSAMYGSTILELMGAPERYPLPPPISVSTATTGSTAPSAPPMPMEEDTFSDIPRPSASPRVATNASDHHFYHYTGTPLGSILYSSDTAATIQDGYYSPRYYLLDDVDTKQIVLVLRGTKSLHDLMIDLTCDAADLWLDHDTTPLKDAQGNVGAFEAKNNRRKQRPFKVHGGFLKAARTIASAETIGIQEKVKAALEARPGYSLLLIGHSLGAGITSILSMLWADPATGLTPEVPQHSSTSPRRPVGLGLASGLGLGVNDQYLPGYLPQNNAESFLPPGRRVRCYAYGTPKVMCPRMSKRAIKLVTSISYGDDIVGRLSLGSVRNIGHAMRALLAMRPPPPPSPPASPSPPSSPVLESTSTEIEVLHDSSETLEDLLEQEGEGLDRTHQQRQDKKEERRRRREQRQAKKNNKPVYKSIGLEIVQKVIRWRLTNEDKLMDEFMDIRRAMHQEMQRHQESYNSNGDFYPDDGSGHTSDSHIDLNKISPVLVPAGKVLWIRPTTLEKELENAETKQHPFESVLHQFEWDHPVARDPTSVLMRNLEGSANDSASMQQIKSTMRSSLYGRASASSSPTSITSPSSQSLGTSPPRSTHASDSQGQEQGLAHEQQETLLSPHGRLHRRASSDSIHTTTSVFTATTTSPVSLHPGSQTTDKLLYRMYAVPDPEHVFDEMLFSRRMWSDHLPLTYEFILAGKHAISVTSEEAKKEKQAVEDASARGAAAI
ncbi:hypothetical protein EDD11_004934 [Mortierella claussenii]|nr:hypothetical protein EDD11_004934 [Mortierella claussenii]